MTISRQSKSPLAYADASSASERVVRDVGPTLGIARYITEHGEPPPLGQIYEFAVFVQEDGADILPLAGTVVTTPEIIRKARRFLRRRPRASSRFWFMRRGRFFVCLDDNSSGTAKPWRTTLDELRRLLATSRDMYDEAERHPDGSWLQPYLYSHWLPMLPRTEAPEFYRGFAHGSRIAIQVHIDLFRNLYTDDLVLLFDVYLAMGAESARRYLLTVDSMTAKPEPENLSDQLGFPLRLRTAHVIRPVQFSRQDAEALIACHDPVRIARLAGEESKTAHGYLFFSDGEPVDYYRGAAAALTFFRRTVDRFLQEIITDPPPFLPAFSSGLETIAVVACHCWARRAPQ